VAASPQPPPAEPELLEPPAAASEPIEPAPAVAEPVVEVAAEPRLPVSLPPEPWPALLTAGGAGGDGSQTTVNPADTVRWYFRQIGERRTDQAYWVLSQRLRAAYSPPTFAAWLAGQSGMQPAAITVVSRTGQHAVVDVVVQPVGAGSEAAPRVSSAERLTLVVETGQWRIDGATPRP